MQDRRDRAHDRAAQRITRARNLMLLYVAQRRKCFRCPDILSRSGILSVYMCSRWYLQARYLHSVYFAQMRRSNAVVPWTVPTQ
jgi:hypothetical protein